MSREAIITAIAILLAFGIAGRIDYDVERAAQIERERDAAVAMLDRSLAAAESLRQSCGQQPETPTQPAARTMQRMQM